MHLLPRTVADSHVTDAARVVVQEALDELLALGDEHAVGLLLDRKALRLTDAECRRVPVAPWRVAYELLQDHASGTNARRSNASAIVADTSAPLGVRLRVALAERIALAPLGGDTATLFTRVTGVGAELSSTAAAVGAALAHTGLESASRLTMAAQNPARFAATSSRAAAYSVLAGGASPKARSIEPDGLAPTIIDDLIDAGGTVEGGSSSVRIEVPGMPSMSLSAYVEARTRPEALSTDAVVALEFSEEAYRRYIEGDDAAAAVLVGSRLADAEIARSIRRGDIPAGEAQDPLLRELLEVIRSPGQADPSVSLLDDASTWGVLISNGVRPPAGGGAQSDRYLDLLALNHARDALFAWEWQRAQDVARDRLRGARHEAARDELLNIIACALWLQNKPEPALAALDSALEGEYTDALLTNAAVVASELEHGRAIDRFVKIAREAPSAHQRAMAAERALLLWANDDARVWASEGETLPADILAAIRPLIGERIPSERYLRILKTLAAHDSIWFAAQPPQAFATNAGSVEVRIFQARARGIEEFVAELSKALRADHADKWVIEERDSIVDTAIGILAEQSDELGAAMFGITLLKGEIPLEPRQRVPLTCLTVIAMVQHIDTDEGEPKDEFIDWILGAKRTLASLEGHDRQILEPMVSLAGDELARTFARARARQIDQARDMLVRVNAQLSGVPAWQINHEKVGELTRPLAMFCRDTWKILHKVRPLISDAHLLRSVDELMRLASDLTSRAENLR